MKKTYEQLEQENAKLTAEAGRLKVENAELRGKLEDAQADLSRRDWARGE